MSEMDEIIESMRLKGIELMQDEEAAVRKLADTRTLKSALAMFDTSPFVLHNMVRFLAQQNMPLPAAGGEKNMSTTIGPAPISMDDLLKLLPQATKEATTFEKSPKWLPNVGEAILIRIKMVRKGNFELPLVIASETAKVGEGGKATEIVKGDLAMPTYVVARVSGKDGGGLTDPQTGVTKPGKFIEGMVYFVRVVGTRDTGKINPYMQVVTVGPLSDFPK